MNAQDALLLVLNVSSMAAAGLGTRTADLGGILRSRGLVARTLAVNLVAIPALAVAATSVAGVPSATALGIVLAASAPGGPTGTLLVRMAGGSVPVAVALLVVSVAMGAVVAPAIVALAGGDAGAALGRLVLDAARFQLLPLVAGGALRAAAPAVAARVEPWLARVGTLSLLVLVLGLLVTRGAEIPRVGVGGLGAITVCVGATLLTRSVAGTPDPAVRTAFALSTTVRNLSLALLLAGFSLRQPDTLLAILAYGLVMFTGATVAASAWRPRGAPAADARLG